MQKNKTKMTPNQRNILRRINQSRIPESEIQKYWAAYMNMARHNLFTTLKFIGETVGVFRPYDLTSRTGDSEEAIPQMAIMTEQLSPEIESKARSLFFKHFPFLQNSESKPQSGSDDNMSIDNNELERTVLTLNDLRIFLSNIAYTLNHYRNKYSHSIFIDNRNKNAKEKQAESEKQCGLYLKSRLTIATRKIRVRYKANKNSEQEGMLDERSLEFLTEGKVKITKDDSGKKIKKIDDTYYLNTLTSDNTLSYFGKIMLVCLLLGKKYTTEFLTQCHFLESFNNENIRSPKLSERRLMLDVMTVSSIRLPEKKLSIEKNDTQIALDILNELKKCPGEIFELLDDNDRKRFNVVSDTGDNILLRRSSDRFPQLALSWLDANNAFPNLRFQVNSGKFRYLFCAGKTCVDGQKRLRVLEEPLNGFRRLKDLEAERVDALSNGSQWLGFSILSPEEAPRNSATVLPYITDSSVRYIFDGDNINLSEGDYMPEIVSLEMNGTTKYKVICKLPYCSISKYELPGLLFYHLLTLNNPTQTEKPAEDIIIETVNNYKRLFRDIEEGILIPDEELTSNKELTPDKKRDLLDKQLKRDYCISISDIPSKMIDYLLRREKDSVTQFAGWKNWLIHDLLMDTTRRKEKLKQNIERISNPDDNKPGKKDYVYLKPGAFASFIAKDIVFFQECSGDKKMTGLNFNVMQSLIATFRHDGPTSLDVLCQAFRNAGLITSSNGKGNHPFLHNVIATNPQGAIDFYKSYLDKKEEYLKGNIPDDAAFLHSWKSKWNDKSDDYYRTLAQRYKNSTIQLPRQLFEEPIRQKLLSIQGEQAQELRDSINSAMNHGRCNIAFMISEFFDKYLNDGPQFFYGLSEGDLNHDHNYRFYSIIRTNVNHAERLSEELQGVYDRKCYSNMIKSGICLAGKYREESFKDFTNVVKTLNNSGDLKHNYVLFATIRDNIEYAKKLVSIESNVPESKNFIRIIKDAIASINEDSYEEFSVKLKSAYHKMVDTEKTLRRYAVQDEVLFLAAKQTIGSNLGNHTLEYRICDIRPQGEGILDHSIQEIATKFFVKNSYVNVIQNNVKVKDYGKVFKLMHDRRVDDLLSLHCGGTVNMNALISELQEYDNSRIPIFDTILRYERKISSGVPMEALLNNRSRVDFKAIQAFDNQNTPEDKNSFKQIRNAFSHNQYPQDDHGLTCFSSDIDIPNIAREITHRADVIEHNTHNNNNQR